MIGRISRQWTTGNKVGKSFAEEVKAKMQMTLRSPYKTFIANFDGFSRIIAKTNEGALIIQSKQPPAAYVLLPGSLKVQLTEEVKNTKGDYIHSGGFAVIHPNNTVEISLVECFERGEETPASKISDLELKDSADNVTGKYVDKIRKQAKADYLRYA